MVKTKARRFGSEVCVLTRSTVIYFDRTLLYLCNIHTYIYIYI